MIVLPILLELQSLIWHKLGASIMFLTMECSYYVSIFSVTKKKLLCMLRSTYTNTHLTRGMIISSEPHILNFQAKILFKRFLIQWYRILLTNVNFRYLTLFLFYKSTLFLETRQVIAEKYWFERRLLLPFSWK